MSNLSSRCLHNVVPEETKDFMGRVFGNPWSEDNPNGIFPMGIAENRLMHNEIAHYINSHISVTPKMLTYGDGPTGSLALRAALASYIDSYFSAYQKVTKDHITVLSGGSSLIDGLCYCLAEEGDGILIARPCYGGFVGDFEDRARVKPVFVDIGDLSDLTTLAGVRRHEEAILESQRSGIKIKGLLLCNPHNPLGRCYPPNVIEAYLSLCSKYSIHFISDEIYAMSIFPTSDFQDMVPFTSVLSLDVAKFIDPGLVHVLYTMSKDFCCNGLRIGALVSQANPILHSTLAAISKFAWASSLSDHVWTLMLTDRSFLDFYFSTFRERMSASYEFCAAMLRERGIEYIPSYAGPFIWVSLKPFLPGGKHTLEAERVLSKRMLDNGIWLATGEAFKSETAGWYRITFAMSEEDVKFGLARLWKVLGLEENQQTSSCETDKDEKNASEEGVGGKMIHVEGNRPNGEAIEVEDKRETMFDFGNS
ncbi:aspartate aminotransferase protein [Rutstroemia sp. NJR-2017a BVV2]|nr:aspartate aminotransferase protein [Rutstroemia sp. NJR-2017a BVV2]